MLTLFSPGFSLMPLKNGRPGFRHRFCGDHNLNGGECPNCRKPLLRFLALDLRDPLLASAPDCPTFPVRVLHLLFCWTCNVAQTPFFYKIVSDNEVRLLTLGAGGVETAFPYEDYPVHFPGLGVALVAPSILRAPDDQPRHQVGGAPIFMQGDMPMRCPECGGPMPFLAAIGDDALSGGRGFVDNPSVQVLFRVCPTCAVLGAWQECD